MKAINNFPRKFHKCPQTLSGQRASGTPELPCAKPTLACWFPPPQVRNLCAKSLNQEVERYCSQAHLLFESKGPPLCGLLQMSWALKVSGHKTLMTLLFSTTNCLLSHVCIDVIITSIRSVRTEWIIPHSAVLLGAWGCGCVCLPKAQPRTYAQAVPWAPCI